MCHHNLKVQNQKMLLEKFYHNQSVSFALHFSAELHIFCILTFEKKWYPPKGKESILYMFLFLCEICIAKDNTYKQKTGFIPLLVRILSMEQERG